jgi:F-type H+-transporting ATPase subunit b
MRDHVVASDNFLLPNATFIAELIAFVLILAIIWRYILPYIQGPLQKRQDLIRQQVKDAEEAKARLEEAEKAYQNALKEARSEAAEIRENARAEAQRTIEEVRTTAQEESARIIARGEEQLANQRGMIVRELRGEIGTLAVELAEKILDQRLSDDANVRTTVDSFITALDAAERAQAGSQS